MFEECYSSNRQKQTVASFSISTGFTVKFELVFVLKQENIGGLILKTTERVQGLLKRGSRNF